MVEVRAVHHLLQFWRERHLPAKEKLVEPVHEDGQVRWRPGRDERLEEQRLLRAYVGRLAKVVDGDLPLSAG